MSRRDRSIAWGYVALLLAAGGCANAADPDGVDSASEALRRLPSQDDPEPPHPPSAPPPTAPPQTTPPIWTTTAIGPIWTTTLTPTGTADLKPDGSMRYIDNGTGSYSIQLNVVNVGTANTQGTSGRVSIDGRVFDVQLYHYWDNTTDAATAQVLKPAARGYLLIADYPNDRVLQPCDVASVQIDLDQTLQFGDAFLNDTRDTLFYVTGSSCTLSWTTPVNAATTGIEPDSTVGDDHGTGWSLQTIVGGSLSGRRDGLRCSSCHNLNRTFPYAPDVPQDGVVDSPIDPYEPISGGRAWAGGDSPWINEFIVRPEKTDYLKSVFRKWLSDGAQL